MITNKPNRIVITCNKRLAPFLEKEILDLGYQPTKVFATGVELMGTLQDCIRLNLNLRCASQVHYSLKQFRAENPEQVYRTVLNMPWQNLLTVEGYFSVTSTVQTPTVNNTLYVNVKVKDAIVDKIRKETGARPNTGPALDKVVIHLFWKDDNAEIFLDTSGETLAKHGYRKIPGKAPMLEALAAGTILATKWNRASTFINPMCGSGTLAIEAMMLATKRVPGLFRDNYSFMHIKGFQRQMYERELSAVKNQVVEPTCRAFATDISKDAIHISKINAANAGVDKYIDFNVCDFELTDVPADSQGVVFFNPEYGERLGDIAELEQTYSRIGDFMKKKCGGYLGYIFTGNLELAKKIGLRASRRIEFYSAKLDCRLLEYELYAGTKRTPQKE